jgi:hypothetical protein
MKSTKVNTEMKESKITLEALLEIISTSVEMFRGVVIETKDKFEVLSMNQIKRYYLPMEVVKFDIDDEVLGIKRLSVVLKAEPKTK